MGNGPIIDYDSFKAAYLKEATEEENNPNLQKNPDWDKWNAKAKVDIEKWAKEVFELTWKLQEEVHAGGDDDSFFDNTMGIFDGIKAVIDSYPELVGREHDDKSDIIDFDPKKEWDKRMNLDRSEEELLTEAKKGNTKNIKKVGDDWRIVSAKTGKLWPQKYDSKEKAVEALRAYHAK